MAENQEWTSAELNYLQDHYLSLGCKGCSQALNRPYSNVQWKARTLGLRHYIHKNWTADEIEFLRKHFPTEGGKWCGNQLGRSFHATHKMAEKLGLEMAWKGSYISDQGYRVICISRTNKILEHRYVMEQHLGRKLESNELIHHLNGDKLDNRIENLVLTSRAAHIQEHRPELLAAKSQKRKPKI